MRFCGEFHEAAFDGIQSVVAASPDIFAGIKFCSSLANQNTAGLSRLSVK